MMAVGYFVGISKVQHFLDLYCSLCSLVLELAYLSGLPLAFFCAEHAK